MRTPQVPVLADAKLIDSVLLELQTGLASQLSWLNHAFGKASQQQYLKEGQRIVRPSVYVGGEDYLVVFPDEHIGNFTFFDVYDPEKLNDSSGFNAVVNAKVGLVLWFDYRSVYSSDWQQRSIDNVKFDLVQALKSVRLRKSRMKIIESFERVDNIYKGYTHNEINRNFLMRPYGGLKIDLELDYNEKDHC